MTMTTRRLGGWLLGAGLPLLLLLGWTWLTTTGRFSESQLPRPSSVVAVVGELYRREELWWHIGTSLRRVIVGFLVGALSGVLLGSLVGLSRWVHRAVTPTVQAIRAVPSLAWVPLLIIWLGIGEAPKITLIAIGAFFPVFTTVVSGLHHADRSLVEVGRAYGLSPIGTVLRVRIPAASPQIFSGLRLGLAQSWLFLVAAELIASSAGLGFLLMDSQNIARTDIVLFSIVVLALLGKASDLLVGIAERRALAWSG
jgi:sulfonate transport system permease protein